MKKKNIAIIGSGISGISISYFLSSYHNITIFEKNDYFGGHTRTIKIKEEDIIVDTGFLVFNEKCYPNLKKFFENLNIKIENSDMSLSIISRELGLEYGSHNYFSQYKNMKNFSFYRIIKDIFLFYNLAPNYLKNNNEMDLSIEDFFNLKNYSNEFLYHHIYPIAASIWSTNLLDIKKFPIKAFIEFFIYNDLFKFINRPQWKTLTNRGDSYIKKILKIPNVKAIKNTYVKNIKRKNNNVSLYSDKFLGNFDEVIIATHADQAINMLENPTEDEINILKTFEYTSNVIILHKDRNQMPENEKIWSSWNFLGNNNNNLSLTYWLNKLQNLKTNNNYFVTVNPIEEIKDEKIINKINFSHPIFTIKNYQAKKDILKIQGINKTWYTGSYLGYGHHEDGITSSIVIAKKMGAIIPWKVNKKTINKRNLMV